MIKTFLISLVIDTCLNALDRTISRRMMMPTIIADLAAGKKLSAKFTVEELMDIRILMSKSIEQEMINALHKEIEQEIDDYIISHMQTHSNMVYC